MKVSSAMPAAMSWSRRITSAQGQCLGRFRVVVNLSGQPDSGRRR